MEIIAYDNRLSPISENGTTKKVRLDPNWITRTEGLSKEAIEFCEYFSRHLLDPYFDKKKNKAVPGRDAISTSQIRNFFGEVRKIQMMGFNNAERNFNMLKPRLAFARIRAEKESERIVDFEKAMIILMQEVNNEDKFQNFTDFLEAVVAYHKANGGN